MRSMQDIADIMRKDWDRRVRHDYRFWINAELSQGSVMWEEGERDFALLASGIESKATHTALEIGCGVGRMLRAASQRFGKVIGIDVSPLAVEKARELIGPVSSVQLIASSGYDLATIDDNSVDFVYSFAALSHMPIRVISSYVAEIKRVLRPTGVARLQLFLGHQDRIAENDTLRLRAFSERALREALHRAGCSVVSITPIELPLKELLEELGLDAVLLTIEPTEHAGDSVDRVAEALTIDAEESDECIEPVSTFEAWLALNYADRLYADASYDRARATLEYVMRYCDAAGVDIRDTLERISNITSKKDSDAVLSSYTRRAEIYRDNMEVIHERFPHLHGQLPAECPHIPHGIQPHTSLEGPVLWFDGMCLDHAEKPIAAADTWVKRSLNDVRFQSTSHIMVVGFAAGYHLDSLLARGTHAVSCVEPSRDVLCAALSVRDVRATLRGLRNLSLDVSGTSCVGIEDAELLTRPHVVALQGETAEGITRAFYARRGLSTLHPKIAVIGPLHGGSLPIAQYVTSTLTRLGQKVRGIDMSPFNGAYEAVASLIMDENRCGLLRQTYVETLSTMVVESIAEKPVDIVICMAQAPLSARALTELKRQGVITVLWFVEDYLRFTYWKEMARYYDFVFTIQKGECIDAIKRAGAGHVHYLPTACDPYIHTPLDVSEQDRARWGSPVSFVGAGYHNRQQMFAALAGYPLRIWGSEWPRCKPFDRLVQEGSRRITPEEYIKIFNATQVNLNLHSSSERDGVDPTGDFLNPRTFELAACGAFQLVDERSLLAEAFKPGDEVVTFNSLSDLRAKIEHYLRHPEECAAIAERARARALQDHTYEKRMEEMLSVVYSRCYQQLIQREKKSPWIRMIQRADFDPELRARCEKAAGRGEEPILDGLVADIVTGQGELSETEQKLLFLFHVRKQILRMEHERAGGAQ